MNIYIYLLLFFVLAFTVISCDNNPRLRRYTEISISSFDTGIPLKSSLSWAKPSHWQEKKGDGLRLATFFTTTEDPVECSIVSLGGMAGGLKANILRWMEQIKLKVSEEELNNFINSLEKTKSSGGFLITLVDLSILQKDENDLSASMLAGLMETGGQTLFVKMTGTKKAIEKEKETFKKFCVSLK